MRITTWAEYSLIISMHLARRARGGQGPVAARDLAEIERLPADYAEQILLRLRRAGLVESVRGAHGGYFMSKDPATVSMLEILSASDRPIFEVNCETHPVDHDRCRPGAGCTIRPVWSAIQRTVDELLGRVSLADLLDKELHVQELVTFNPSA
jgi:Rrf2 family transcriptional regulator, cysteine metabolism repressor